MKDGLSMRSRAEITARYADAYARASKKDKGRILDAVCEVTHWSRDNARRRLTAKAARRRGPVVRPVERKPRPFKYSYDARKVLRYVWAVSGGLCGRYLKAAMRSLLD
ncbi:MAG: integrase, partial [Propionibacteriaceae bacterium]|nr:integrase [Propionibacteriaceae bacterium]